MKRTLSIAALILFLIGILGFTLAYQLNYSNGYRSGTVVKMSLKGAVFKTYEGELHIGGMASANGGDMTSGLWSFSVEKGDDEVLKAIEDAVDGRYPVKLRYHEKFFKFFWRGETEYFIYAVERVGKKE